MNSVLQANNLTASYNGKIILNNISLQITQGDFICLCGPNGSGKSTLLSCLAGIPQSSLKLNSQNCILYDSISLSKFKPFEIAKNIAFLQQSEFCTWNFSVEDFILQGRFCHSKNGIYSKQDFDIVKYCLEILEITDLASKNIKQISGGEFQKVRLARALAQQPKFLILDEPAANLDFFYEPKLMEILKKLSLDNNIGIIISIHNLNIASQFAKKIFLLSKCNEKNSQIYFSGSVKEIFTKDILFQIFNQDFTLYEHPVNKSIQII